MATYNIIELEPTRTVELVDHNGMKLEKDVFTPGAQLYQIVLNDGSIEYRAMDGTVTTPVGGYSIVGTDVVPPVWATPDTTVASAAEPESRVITKLDYMNRFHDDELAALYTAAKTVVQVEVWLEKFKVADFIDLADPRTAAGVHALEASGIIGVGRAAEILA